MIGNKRVNKPEGVLEWCSPHNARSLPFPSPYEADCVYKHRYALTLAHHRRLNPNRPLAWSLRRPLAVWRGTCTGLASLYTSADRAMASVPRVRIALLSKQHPSHLDAAIFPCGRCSRLAKARPLLFGNASQALTDAGYQQFKYVVDLDGDGCSGRLSKLLGSGSLVLKPWEAGVPFFQSALIPWVHYVPVKTDLSDLIERIEWLQQNDDKAKAMADAASAFALKYLTSQSVDAYTEALLRGVAKLQKRHTVRIAKDDTLVWARTSTSPLLLDLHNATDHKGRPLDIVCPADRAPEWMLPIASADALVQDYFTHANGGRSLQ